VPTWEAAARFRTEWATLTPLEREAFLQARTALVKALVAGERPPPRLGVKRFLGEDGVFELRWARDGRALWKYGPEISGRTGPHIIWLRIGTHDIYR
jgi:hypothetical protein